MSNWTLELSCGRKTAEAKRSEIAKNLHEEEEAQIKELKARRAEIQKWTRAQFELSQRDVIDKPKVMGEMMEHWQKAHEAELYQLLQYPEKSGGSIESGRALNKCWKSSVPPRSKTPIREKSIRMTRARYSKR